MRVLPKMPTARLASALLLMGIGPVPRHLSGQVPNTTITGPIAATAPGDPGRGFPYNSTAIELEAHGYVEEEYFISGTANRYSSPDLETAEVVDSGHAYKTRFIVRRPRSEDFNGTVVIEWLNVTNGPDKDIDWWQAGHHLIRAGYAYIGVSAQRVGVESLKEWSPSRYGSLDVTENGAILDDALSYDIFSAVARAVIRQGASAQSGRVDILAGLRAGQLIASGHSQSAARLAIYVNNVHPREPVFDGAMIRGGGGRIRDDQDIRVFKLMAETDMRRQAANPQPDSHYFRQWEVAGSSHVDIIYELEYARMRALAAGQPIESAVERPAGCDLPAYSRVPFRDVMGAAFEHMRVWIETGTPPPVAPRLEVVRTLPQVEFARDARGNILGGIQLAEHAVPTARNTGFNSGSGGLCSLSGSHEPFDRQTLRQLYPDHRTYVDAVRAVAEQNVADGYILPEAAERTIREAEMSSIGNR